MLFKRTITSFLVNARIFKSLSFSRLSGIEGTNRGRLTAVSFSALYFGLLDVSQYTRQKLSGIARCEVQSRFPGAEFRSGGENAAENTLCIVKALDEGSAELCPGKPVAASARYASKKQHPRPMPRVPYARFHLDVSLNGAVTCATRTGLLSPSAHRLRSGHPRAYPRRLAACAALSVRHPRACSPSSLFNK